MQADGAEILRNSRIAMWREVNGNVEWRPFALTWSQIGDIFVENTLKIADAAGGNERKYGGDFVDVSDDERKLYDFSPLKLRVQPLVGHGKFP